MELRDATILLLGGSGLVGSAITRRLLQHRPRRIIISGLTADDVGRAVEEIGHAGDGCIIEGATGNIFLPADIALLSRAEIEADAVLRRRVVDEMLGPLTEDVLQSSLLFRWLVDFKPDVVVDCVNTATALAYRDLSQSSRTLLASADGGTADSEVVERHLLTLELPQLVRHVQILAEGLRRSGSAGYVKIGTSGTGGMGLNIPYTHSEERPSRTLMSKSAVAGAHSMFMFLLGRTPGMPAIIEVKPTAAIGWREIAFGPVRRRGVPIQLADCVEPLPLNEAFAPGASGWMEMDEMLQNAYIDVGENGVFAHDEFETVTALGQMELVTAEEIADVVVLELMGRPTGRDIVAALDGATLGPTYRAGVLRSVALDGLKALERASGVRSVAFEMLGPPRLTKLLFEAFILSRICSTVAELGAAAPATLSAAADGLLRKGDASLRRQIISVGIPILLSSGNEVMRGPHVAVVGDGDWERCIYNGWSGTC